MEFRLVEATPLGGVGIDGSSTYYYKFLAVDRYDIRHVYFLLNKPYAPGATFISFISCTCDWPLVPGTNYSLDIPKISNLLSDHIITTMPTLPGNIITLDMYGGNLKTLGILIPTQSSGNATLHMEESPITMNPRDLENAIRNVFGGEYHSSGARVVSEEPFKRSSDEVLDDDYEELEDEVEDNNENSNMPEPVEVQKIKAVLEQYKELISSLKEGPYTIGTIISSEYEHMYRIKKDSGDEIIMAAAPMKDNNNEIPENEENHIFPEYQKGDRVILNDAMIVDYLPEELKITAPEIQFDFIEWTDIGGLKSQVAQLRETIEYPIKYKELYEEYGLKPSRGVLLYGPAGCGKTMIAKAIASTFLKGNAITPDSFIYMKGGEMLDPYVGVAERNIKNIFERARNNYKKTGTRSVIFIDEAEAILPARGSRKSSDVETTIVPTFLSEMDGLEESNTFIILATNFPRQLDPAVIRPGRIDLKIEVGRPTQEDAEDIFRIYLSKTKCAITVTELAEKAAGALFSEDSKKGLVSGAMIRNIVESAMLSAIKRAIGGDDNGINLEDILNATTS